MANVGRYDNQVFGPRGPLAGATVAVLDQPADTSRAPGSPLSMLSVDITGNTYSIAASTGASRSNGFATFTLTIPHQIRVGERVIVSLLSDPSFNGPLTIAAVTSTTISGAQDGPNAVSGNGTLSAVNPIQADSLGNFHFYGLAGQQYTVQIYGAQIATPLVLADQELSLVPGGNVALGTVTTKSLNGNPVANQYPDLQTAITAAGAADEVYLPGGTYQPTSAITAPSPIRITGAGPGVTIIKPTAALAAALFTCNGAGIGYQFANLTIDMTTAPSQGVFSFSGVTRPILENLYVLYPQTGTGTAIFKTNTGEMHATNVIIHGCGIGIDIQGDSGQEDFWTNVVIEDPGTAGYRISRTTTTDVGGQYLKGVKVTNPGGRTGAQPFIITSTVAATAQPMFMEQCVGDNAQGGPALYVHNCNQTFVTGSWFTSGAPPASNIPGIQLDNVTEFFMLGGLVQSQSRDLVMSGSVTTARFTTVKFSGTSTNIYAAGATLSGIRLIDPIFSSATPASAADLQALVNAAPASPISTSGGELWCRGAGGSQFGYKVINKASGIPTPSKTFRVTDLGWWQILADNGSTALHAMTDTGDWNFAGRGTIDTGIANNGSGVKHSRVTTGSVAASSSVDVTVTWGTAFADANYSVNATVLEGNAGNTLVVGKLVSQAASNCVVRVFNNDPANARTGTLTVIAIHD